MRRRAGARRGAAATIALAALAAGCARGPAAEAAAASAAESLDARAARIHRDAIVVDTHSDTTLYFQDASFDFAARHPKTETHMDLPRIREGGLDVEFWSIYMGERPEPGSAIREALERIDAVHEMVARTPGVALATSEAEVRAHVAAGRFVSMMGIEGGHILEDSLAALRTFHRLGVRYVTLTHSFHTSWADSAGTREVPPPLHGGLTDRGREIVAEMNRIGMMVDVSHVADATFWDVIAATRAPVIASHSSCRAVHDHVRNLDDAMLRALAANGGVAMINFYSGYIDPEVGPAIEAWYREHGPAFAALGVRFADDGWGLWLARRAYYAAHPMPQAPLARLLDHFDHAIAVAGPDHVGIGADWDGIASLPEGLDEVNLLPALTRGLLERGHPEATVRKVLGENLLRVLREVEDVARQSASAGAGAPPRAG
ncbi:MAG: dipeptidase [Myxococcota bacterium]